jgi:cell division protein FtsI (penicillin-binding protein 3)
LRVGFLAIAFVLSLFGARLFQLQAFDAERYASRAAAEGAEEVVLPATRGDILDRNGQPLAESVEGRMVIADPALTAAYAADLATFLAKHLDVDYIETLERLRKEGSRYQYVARQVPATVATDIVQRAEDRGWKGLMVERDPVRSYPRRDVAANLVGFLGTPDPTKGVQPLAGFERTFNDQLSGTDGLARWQSSGGNRIPLAESTTLDPVDGQDLTTTIDADLQWYVQRVLREARENAGAESALAVVMDTKTGQTLAFADDPTYDATDPLDSPEDDLGSRAISDVYEPGSVQKALTAAALIDAGEVTPRTRIEVPPVLKKGNDYPIRDWFTHPLLRLTMTGVIAKSSNIGTVRAAESMSRAELRRYLLSFGLGKPVGVGIRGEAPGIVPAGAAYTPQVKDRMVFGQSLSVNALQMTAAINAIANGGVYVDPSVVLGSATTDDGRLVGSDSTTTRRVVSTKAARGTARMMEMVLDPEDGVAPGAAVPGYRVAGKTGTAQRVGPECGCYDGTFSVSFAGFAPADDPRFTVYVVLHAPTVDGGGGSLAGPVFSKIMSFALRRYHVPPTGTEPADLPVEWR